MGRSPGGHNRVWVTEHAPQAHTNDSSGCRLHPLKWSWSTLRIPSQLLKRLYDLKACRLSQQREISTVVSILKHSCKRKGSLLSDSSTLLEPSYHWYLLCQKCWVGAKKTTCSEYLTPQTQIPTLISSWKANRCLEYVMSETELIISTPLILKSYYSPFNKCYPTITIHSAGQANNLKNVLESSFSSMPESNSSVHFMSSSPKSISNSSTLFRLHHHHYHEHYNSKQSHFYRNEAWVF